MTQGMTQASSPLFTLWFWQPSSVILKVLIITNEANNTI